MGSKTAGMGLALVCLMSSSGIAAATEPDTNPSSTHVARSVPCSATCGRVSSCREAVYLWCVCNYRRADGDGDGVPCERVCGQSTKKNREKVQAIAKELGCR